MEQSSPPRRWRARTAQNGGYAATPAPEEESSEAPAAQTRSQPRQFPRPAKAPAVGELKSACVIGGGPSGLACCRALCDAGLAVTLVQESRGLGGKLCTKFINGHDDPTLHFDMGVQLLRPAGALAAELEGVVEPWPSQGRFKRLRCSGGWSCWRLESTADLPTDGYVVGVPSMSRLGRHLASRCEGLSIHLDRTAHVRGRDPTTGCWEVEWRREEATGGQLRYRPELSQGPSEVQRGDFDAVVLAYEVNKVLRGCKSGYKMVQPSAVPSIRKRLSAGPTKTSQVWNLMVAFDVELPMPWDAATVEGHRSIAWVAVDSSKPQRARVPQCFMAFSTREWADWKQWGKREVEKDLLEELILLLTEVLGRRPPKPCFVLSGRWGNNTEAVMTSVAPVGEFPMRALGHEDSGHVVWDSSERMGATGDWTRGYSVSDAYTAGLELADTILRERKVPPPP